MRLNEEHLNITDNLDFFARQAVEGFLIGMHKSPYHGFSVEFAEHRLYNQGDSLKNIDWKLFARSGKFFVKKFEEETNLRSYILIDNSSSMNYPKNKQLNKLNFSIYASACLMYLFKKQRDGFGLSLFNEKVDFFAQAKNSVTHYNRLIAELDRSIKNNYKVENKSTDFPSILSSLIDKMPQRSLIILFSDMMNFDKSNLSSFLDSIQSLKYSKHEVILFHVQDFETEKKFTFPNKPINFIDLENNNEVKFNPLGYREIYQEKYSNFIKIVEETCYQSNIDYVPTFIDNSFENVISSYLIKRSKLF